MSILNLLEQLSLHAIASMAYMLGGQPIVPPVASAPPIIQTVPMPPARPRGTFLWEGAHPLPPQNHEEAMRFVG
jgi:hypothetical protein